MNSKIDDRRGYICSPDQLPPHDEHRATAGAEHLAELGPRAIICFLFWVVGTRPSVSELLDKMASWRAGLPLEMVVSQGGDRIPGPRVRLVPRDLRGLD